MNENNAWLTEAALMDLEKQVQRDIPRFGPNVHIGVRAGLLREMLSKLRAPKPLGDSCHHCGWTDWLSQDGKAYCQACGKPHGSVPAEGLPNLPELLRENADLDEAEGGNPQVCALERDAADEIERLRREVAKLRAPVAGEAQPVAEVVSRYGDPEAFGERDLKVLVDLNSYPYDAKFYPAPQASEADPLQGAADWLMRAFEPPLSASDLARQLVIGYNRATRLRDAALSAQPGAQKNCNCATCRPHSVEMRMILCEVCGDKRCPHAADHRNECSNQPKQHNDGGDK